MTVKVNLSFDSEILLALYFKSSKDLTITMDGYDEYTTGRTGSYQYIHINGIKAEDLDRYYTVKISDGTGNYTVTYSPMTYSLYLIPYTLTCPIP